MSEIDGATLALGCIAALTGLVALVRPHSFPRSSRRNWEARMRELDSGAPESFFEERRELRSYPPRFNPSNTVLRCMGAFGIYLGISLISQSLS